MPFPLRVRPRHNHKNKPSVIARSKAAPKSPRYARTPVCAWQMHKASSNFRDCPDQDQRKTRTTMICICIIIGQWSGRTLAEAFQNTLLQ